MRRSMPVEQQLRHFVTALCGWLLLQRCLVAAVTNSAADKPIIVYPSRDTYVASSSAENVTYTCTVTSPGRVPTWEIKGEQIITSTQISRAGMSGFFIREEGNFSEVVFTPQSLSKSLTLLCVARTIDVNYDTVKGDTFRIIVYGIPEEIRSLKLDSSGREETLMWKRPQNSLDNVPITYKVSINTTEGVAVSENYTANQFLSLGFIERQARSTGRRCELYSITVEATNEDGTGPPSESIVTTIPTSPDVSNISEHLTVETVDLRSLTVDISFPQISMNQCDGNITLQNYSITIDGSVVMVLPVDGLMPSGDGNVRRQLSLFNQVTLGSSYDVAVSACTDFNCKYSSSVNLNTTGTQVVQALLYQNDLFLRCTFADGSDVRGCVVKFSLRGGNGTEDFQVLRTNGSTMCNKTANQFEAYDSVVASDILSDGTEGNATLLVMLMRVDTHDELLQLTGQQCPQNTSGSGGVGPQRTNINGIVGGVVAAIVVIALVVAVIVLTVAVANKWRKKEKERKIEVNGTYKYVIREDKSLQVTDDSTSRGPPPPPSKKKERGTQASIEVPTQGYDEVDAPMHMVDVAKVKEEEEQPLLQAISARDGKLFINIEQLVKHFRLKNQGQVVFE